MDSLSTAVNSASKVIWGGSTANTNASLNARSGEEPLSGEIGNVREGEPYDAGNLGDSTETEKTSTASSTTHSSLPTTATSSNPTDSYINSNPATNTIRSEHDTVKTGVISAHQPTSGAFASDALTSTTATTADPSSGVQSTTKHQGADRPYTGPGGEETQAIKDTKRQAEEAAIPKENENNGDAPTLGKEGSGASSGSGDIGEGGTSGGMPGMAGSEGLQKENHSTGTGEKHMKSTGMKADGGDFDAANAGAGREADRLLDQKDIRHEPGLAKEPEGKKDVTHDHGSSRKPSLAKKIKAKLHKN